MAEKKRSAPVLVAIGIYSLAKAASLVLIAFVAHKLLGGHAADVLQHWVEDIRVDPGSKLVHALIAKITGLSPHKLRALEIGTLLYAGVFLIEGIGLVLKKRWAEYVTIASTVTFLPIEIYEMYEHLTAVRISVFVANLLMVIYLVISVRKK